MWDERRTRGFESCRVSDIDLEGSESSEARPVDTARYKILDEVLEFR